ncbi:hypothetical protein ACWDG1_09320 [Streptomyces sp. NPDC001177]
MSQPHYPYRSGDMAVLGPGVTATAGGERITWQGAAYRRDHGEHVGAATPLICSDERHAAKVAALQAAIARVREAVAILEEEMATAQQAGHELAAYALTGAILRITTALKESDPAATQATDGPACRYCGADCSNGRSWDGGNLYACGPCANDRAAINGAGGDYDALVQRVRDRQQQRADRFAATLRQALDGYWKTGCLNAVKYAEYAAVLDQPVPVTDAEGRIVCTCTIDTPCGCGTSVHYQPTEQPGP